MNPNQIRKLGEKNYESWKIQVRSLLVYNELWQYTNGTEVKTEENEQEWTKRDEKALALILLSVEENQLNHVKKAETSNEAWQNLQRVHQSKGPVRRAALYRELNRLKKDAHQTMTQYTNSFQEKLEQLEEAGVNIPDELASIMLLGSLPTEYENFAIAIETRDVLPNLESLKLKLIEEEARKRENHEEEIEDPQNNAFMTQKRYPPRFKNKKFENYHKQAKFNGNCNICNKYGHRAKECYSRQNNVANKRSDVYKRGDAMLTTALYNCGQNSRIWYLDSGATTHITNEEQKFRSINDHRTEIYTGTNEKVGSTGKGQIDIEVNTPDDYRNKVKLNEAVLVPNFKNNLLSVSQIAKNGYKVTFYKDGAKVRRPDGSIAMSAKERDGLYVVEESTKHGAVFQADQGNPLMKWHNRLGHLNFSDVHKLKRNNMADGINDVLQNENIVCEVCIKAKINQLPYTQTNNRETETLGLVHSDICGPFSVESLGGARYFMTFIDDKSRYIQIKTLKKRSEALEAFKEYKARVEKLTGKQIKRLRTDNGREYLSHEFNEFLKREGISRQLTVEYTPQQNGVAERANRTLVEMARCMLAQAGAPMSLWAEAINAATFIRNRCPTRANLEATPYEIWTGRRPYIGFLRGFGSRVIALEKGKTRNKFAMKGKEYVLVGYSNEAKAYRLWEKGTRRVINRRDVRFIEDWNKAPSEDEIHLFDAPMEPISEQEEEQKKKRDDVQEAEESEREEPGEEFRREGLPSTQKRGPGRPRMERTGKRGRPRKLFSTGETQNQDRVEPTTVTEAMDGPDQNY